MKSVHSFLVISILLAGVLTPAFGQTPTPTPTPTPIPIEMVTLPAGTFTMGRRDDGEDELYGASDELPRHQVALTAYQIGKYEVTNAEYAEVLNWARGKQYLKDSNGQFYPGGDVYANGQALLYITDPTCQISYSNGVFVCENRQGYPMADHPVVDVIWYGSVAFCNWLSEKEGRTPCYTLANDNWELTNPFGGGYRLPSEAEWERAAAWDGSKHWIYGFRSDTLTGKNRCNYRDVNPLGLSSYPYNSPVGWFNGTNVNPNGDIQTVNSPSPVGCYDMSGNVWEWCEDRYHTSYIGAPTDGSAWLVQQSDNRVIRGGFWYSDDGDCRSASRGSSDPTDAVLAFGFRLARTADESIQPSAL